MSVNISPIENGSGHIVESGTVGQQIRLYYHQDLRGTVDYLTSPVSQKVESWTHYNEWGEITHNAALGVHHLLYPQLRRLKELRNRVHLQKNDSPTGHDYNDFNPAAKDEMVSILRQILEAISTTPLHSNFDFLT